MNQKILLIVDWDLPEKLMSQFPRESVSSGLLKPSAETVDSKITTVYPMVRAEMRKISGNDGVHQSGESLFPARIMRLPSED